MSNDLFRSQKKPKGRLCREIVARQNSFSVLNLFLRKCFENVSIVLGPGFTKQVRQKESGQKVTKEMTETSENVRAGFRQNGFFADFYFWATGFFRGFSRRILSPHFCGKKCPEKSSRKIPGKILQKVYNKNPPTHFCRLPRAKNVTPKMTKNAKMIEFLLPTACCGTLTKMPDKSPPYFLP